MYNFLIKHGQLIALAVGALGIVVFLINALSGLSSMGIDYSTNLYDLDKEVVSQINGFNFGLYLAIVLIIIAAAAWVLFGIYRLASHPASALKGIIPFALIVVLFIILYASSTAETTGRIWETAQQFNITEGISKLISGALWTAVGLIGVALLALLFSEIRNALK
jgi:hypothetical protein